MNKIISICILFIIITIWGCGKSSEDQPNDKQNSESEEQTGGEDLDDYVENMKEMKQNMEEGKKYEVVDFRELKAFLPESIGDLKRSNAQGEKNSAMGFTISRAEADYSTEDGSQRIDIEITDMTGASGLAGFAAWGWTIAEIDKETETGYEKITTYKGHKAFEKYDSEYQSGSIEMLVASRFMVSVRGNNVPMETVKSAVDEIDVGKLAGMKDAGAISE